MDIRLETDRYHFVETETDIFKTFFTDIWPVTDIRLTTDTDVSKFAHRCICRYLKKIFWLKLVWIAYSPDLRQSNYRSRQTELSKKLQSKS